ncbi:MAG TPA: hypothetical protein VIO61_05285 [Anaerolineaceae bacterium]
MAVNESARQDLFLATPWMNASGTLGFLPPPRWSFPAEMGAFITNPISLRPRHPARERAVLEYPGGFLLHSGLPNPGLRACLNRFAARWAKSSLPTWLHLLVQNPSEAREMAQAVEGLDGVMVLEIGIPSDLPGKDAIEMVSAACAELPVVLNLPLNRAGEDWLGLLPSTGVSAISLGAPRGALLLDQSTLLHGRLYGPALLPLALGAVISLQRLAIPVIAAGGIYSVSDGEALLSAGACAVQVDAALWKPWINLL